MCPLSFGGRETFPLTRLGVLLQAVQNRMHDQEARSGPLVVVPVSLAAARAYRDPSQRRGYVMSRATATGNGDSTVTSPLCWSPTYPLGPSVRTVMVAGESRSTIQ